jgi:hypothetical protein
MTAHVVQVAPVGERVHGHVVRFTVEDGADAREGVVQADGRAGPACEVAGGLEGLTLGIKAIGAGSGIDKRS